MIKIFELDKMSEREKEKILKRSSADILSVKKKVSAIIEDVKTKGDRALLEYTEKFDGVKLSKDSLKVSKEEIKSAYKNIDKKILNSIKRQITYSRKFALAQKSKIKKQWKIKIISGVIAGQKITPLESVGLYIPGGRAPYPTVMQILAVPAKIAGVKRIIAVTPPQKNGKIKDELLVAGDFAGVDEFYKIGGAQAIAALAYGTETVPKVLKIVGPGNIFVTAAKLLCFGEISIDMPAGPSEAIILADKTASPKFTAADILARAEHDPNAAGVLVTNSKELAIETKKEIKKQARELSRFDTIKESLKKNSAIIVTKTFGGAISFTNEYAPEHLEIQVKNPWKILQKIKNAGSIFLGNYAPVAVGDYASGTNHVLPTGQYAKMFSSVGVETFMKNSEFQFLTKSGLRKLNDEIIQNIAGVEGFDGHAKSVSIRFEKEGNKNGKSWNKNSGIKCKKSFCGKVYAGVQNKTNSGRFCKAGF